MSNGGSDSGSFGYGQQTPNDFSTELNAIAFVIRQMMSQLNIMQPVKVQTVHGGAGAIAVAGTVDVLPLVNQIDGKGFSTPQGTVYGIPWFRLQGGNGAVICDPVANDIGFVVCADRDISNVKTSKQQSNPGSPGRRYDIVDGIYIGGCLNGAPTAYLAFASTGIQIADGQKNTITTTSTGMTLTDPNGNKITMNASGVNLTDVNGNKITLNTSGINLTDINSNKITMSASGINLTDVNGNQMQMLTGGIVNFVCTFLQVNGVTVTVP
jgi:hypothetical protein